MCDISTLAQRLSYHSLLSRFNLGVFRRQRSCACLGPRPAPPVVLYVMSEVLYECLISSSCFNIPVPPCCFSIVWMNPLAADLSGLLYMDACELF